VRGAIAGMILMGVLSSSARAGTPAEADSFYAHQEWKAAARAYDELARTDPARGRYQFRLGVSRLWLRQWPEAIAAFRRAETLGIPPMFTRYHMARTFARAGEPDSALAALAGAVAHGYAQADTIEQNPDFRPIHGMPGYAEAVAQARRTGAPCVFAAESRQFDFWVGDWEVRDNRQNRAVVGSSHVERILNQCVIFENWTSIQGGTGKSVNAWNPDLKCWQQTWMDDRGGVINFTDGHWDGTRLMFVADTKAADGTSVKNRLSFFPLGPDEVRQFSENSSDGGATWTVDYDFHYRRRKG
jgi:hypothetical protein